MMALKEASRTDFTYDDKGRLTGKKTYKDGILISDYTDYSYNGNEVVYTMNGTKMTVEDSLKSTIIIKKNYLDSTFSNAMLKKLEFYESDGTTLIHYFENTFDDAGRIINSKDIYPDGIYLESNNYKYDGNVLTYDNYAFDKHNDSIHRSKNAKHKIVYFDETYNPDKIISETSSVWDESYINDQVKYTYDKDGREIGYILYSEEKPYIELTDYAYNDKAGEVTFTVKLYDPNNGELESTRMGKRIYKR